MHARATLVEIDIERVGVDEAVELFRWSVLPELRRQPGYRGTMVLSTPVGKGILLSFWDAAEQAAATSFYHEVIEKYVVLFRSPPGREQYEVRLAELPPAVIG